MDKQSLSQLHNLNALLHLATLSSEESAQDIRKAIDFTMEGALDEDGPTPFTLDETARVLLSLHTGQNVQPAFALCDLRAQEFEPLFLREKLMQPLRKLAGCPEAILLVTGLRRMVCPPGKRFTQKRQQQYQSCRSYIEDLAKEHSAPTTRMHLLFL